MNIKSFIKYYLFIIILIDIPTNADPLDKFIKQINDYISKPELINIDYTLHKYKRSNENQKSIDNYKLSTTYSQAFIVELIQKLYEAQISESIKDMNKIDPITPILCRPYFEKLKKNGQTLKNADLILISAKTGYSLVARKYGNIKYSHCGIIWIKNDVPYVIQVHPSCDLIILPLIDFLFPKYPQNFAFGIYRPKFEIDFIDADYLFRNFEKFSSNILFDYINLTNLVFDDPENYFKSKNFFYCTELPYLCYSFLGNGIDCLSNINFDTKKFIGQFMTITPMLGSTIDIFESLYNNKSKRVIIPEHYTQSEYFEQLIALDTTN